MIIGISVDVHLTKAVATRFSVSIHRRRLGAATLEAQHAGFPRCALRPSELFHQLNDGLPAGGTRPGFDR